MWGPDPLPGLINCHVHLCLGGEADPIGALRDEPVALTALKAMVRALHNAGIEVALPVS